MTDLRLALLQCESRPGDVPANLARLDEACRNAATEGACLIVTPEMFLTGYDIGRSIAASLAEPPGGARVDAVRAMALRHRIAIAFGHPERDETGSVFNTAQFIDERGELLGSHRKSHLFGALDKDMFSAGSRDEPVFEFHGWKVGLLICFDIEFPENARRLALQGADLIVVPTANMIDFDFVATTLIRTRAYENQLFVAYANFCGRESSLTYGGLSGVAAPNGSLIAQGGRDPVLLLADVGAKALSDARESIGYVAVCRSIENESNLGEVRMNNEPVKAGGTAIDPLYFAATRVSTFNGSIGLTNASGFFFEREERLFLVTSRHVVIDAESDHLPDRLEIELHLDAVNLTRSIGLSALLYKNGLSVWRQGKDLKGEIDVAVLELNRAALPAGVVIAPFTPAHLQATSESVAVDESLFVIGFPLGFHDGVHHLPVVRHAILASPFGIRFQGQGFFLTDARTHRGTSGAAVVMRNRSADAPAGGLDWKLVGIHSSRIDMGDRDLVADESLGLNCAWYSDILMVLTDPKRSPVPASPVK